MSPFRSLHVCNLANVAYGYCKLLEQAGHPVTLRCHDLRHLMSQPEWDDLELLAEDFPNEWDFFENTADFGEYERPDWFRSVEIHPAGVRPMTALPPGAETASGGADPSRSLAAAARSAWMRLPMALRRPLKVRIKSGLFAYRAWRSQAPFWETYRAYRDIVSARLDRLLEESRKAGPRFAVTRDMLASFQPHAWWMRQEAAGADLVFAYVYAPIYALLLGEKPFVSVEIGTMRETPFDGTDAGRMLALAYRLSPHVLITNPDVVGRAEELGVESYSFCPHPLDETIYRPDPEHQIRQSLLERDGADYIFFAPARQNWAIKRNDRYLKAFARLVRDDEINAVLIIPGWGQEVERSQQLCSDLEIESRVRWIKPQSEASLVKYYRAADFVLDQFHLGVFGLITPKAMACGAVVVTSYDRAAHEWCFDQHPPLVAARTSGEIRRTLLELCNDRQRRLALGEQARTWVLGHHSKGRIRTLLEEAAGIARERHLAARTR